VAEKGWESEDNNNLCLNYGHKIGRMWKTRDYFEQKPITLKTKRFKENENCLIKTGSKYYVPFVSD
jgi:hypothetical protein